jgi:PTS system nitrogen regulatory IIA component
MELNQILGQDRIIASLRVQDKLQLLKELARRAANDIGLSESRILSALQAREDLGSTGLGSGIAIPHARIPGLQDFYGLFVRLERPVDYVAIDSKPVDLVCLLLTPDTDSSNHIAILAAASRRLRDPESVKAIRACDPRSLYDCLSGQRL